MRRRILCCVVISAFTGLAPATAQTVYEAKPMEVVGSIKAGTVDGSAFLSSLGKDSAEWFRSHLDQFNSPKCQNFYKSAQNGVHFLHLSERDAKSCLIAYRVTKSFIK